MAKMNGCNDQFHSVLKAQGKNTVTPGKSARNNLGQGAVNKHLGGTDKPGKKPSLGSGKNGAGKYRHDSR